MWRVLLELFVVNNFFHYVWGDCSMVSTRRGLIKGLVGTDWSMYLGIPYARIDGDNPFGPSEPYPNFDRIYKAVNDPPACPQMLNGIAIGDLDCLRLNIFIPKISRVNLPVIVWLHGGSFDHGYTTRRNFDPKNLVKHGVIVVTLNYRLGPYGFMCLDTRDVPGNQGLKDQVIAMRWIKDNIEAFGGDAENITLMGESAGAASVDAHLLSKNENLFNKVILQSGSTMKPGNIVEPDASIPLKISERLGFVTENASAALIFLGKEDPKTVILATSELSLKWAICVENKFDNIESVLTDRPYNLRVPNVKGMDVLAGYNSREGLVMNAVNPSQYLNNPNFFSNALKNIFVYDDEFEAMVDIVRQFYIGDAGLTEDVRSSVIDFQSDFFYNFPLQWTLDKYLKNGAGNIYRYMFSYYGNLNYIKNIRNISLEGACHGDELGYLFVIDGNDGVPSKEDELVIDRMTTLWSNFAKYGNPLPEQTDLLPVTWQPITGDSIPYLNIDSEVTMKTRPFKERLAFWKLFYLANQHRLKGFRHY